MKALSTDQGTSWLGFLMLVYGGISQMPEGNLKAGLHLVILVVAAIICYSIKGSGLSHEDGKKLMDSHDDLQEVLKKGRE